MRGLLPCARVALVAASPDLAGDHGGLNSIAAGYSADRAAQLDALYLAAKALRRVGARDFAGQ
ncbi:hypothetical protein SAMN04515621_0915 [Erythrobacter sp. HL-111]|nr:MAG: hypothetical protein HLUCCO15_03285 [Erythrobacteraceae bacterium HL-111]SDS07772.1 hypothetical protein SAMN04515621_0915 [Erythrobacter sp. HL-111]